MKKMIFNKLKNIEKDTIEELSDKYVEENKEKQKLEEKIEKYMNWKKLTIKDIKELKYYIELHTKDFNYHIMKPIIDELDSIIERVIH